MTKNSSKEAGTVVLHHITFVFGSLSLLFIWTKERVKDPFVDRTSCVLLWCWGSKMDQIFNKVGSYWFNQKASSQLNSVGDDINVCTQFHPFFFLFLSNYKFCFSSLAIGNFSNWSIIRIFVVIINSFMWMKHGDTYGFRSSQDLIK